jgi:hypothetical protein
MAQRKKFLLRIDPTLWEELNRWASAELRSVNGQIEFILKQAVMRRTGSSPEPESGYNPDTRSNEETP